MWILFHWFLNQENVCKIVQPIIFLIHQTGDVMLVIVYSPLIILDLVWPAMNVDHYAYGNYWVISCPNHINQKISSQICVPCDETCLTCFGSMLELQLFFIFRKHIIKGDVVNYVMLLVWHMDEHSTWILSCFAAKIFVKLWMFIMWHFVGFF